MNTQYLVIRGGEYLHLCHPLPVEPLRRTRKGILQVDRMAPSESSPPSTRMIPLPAVCSRRSWSISIIPTPHTHKPYAASQHQKD